MTDVVETVPVDLEGPMQKLARAAEHIRTLRAEVHEFLAGRPAPFDTTIEPTVDRTGLLTVSVTAVIRRAPPPSLALIAGDAIHNLRCVLDHLAYEMTPPSGRAVLGRDLGFPIASERGHYPGRFSKMLASFAAPHCAFVEAHQPFQSQQPLNHPLAVLRELSNRDKHRLRLGLVPRVDHDELWVGARESDTVHVTYVAQGVVTHGDEIARFTARSDDPAVPAALEPHAAMTVGIDLASGMGIVDMLEWIDGHVRHGMIGAYFNHGIITPLP